MAENRIAVIRKWAERLKAARKLATWPNVLWQLEAQFRAQPFRMKEGGYCSPYVLLFGREMPVFVRDSCEPIIEELQNPPVGPSLDVLQTTFAARDAAQAVFFANFVSARADRFDVLRDLNTPVFQIGTPVKVKKDKSIGGKTNTTWHMGYEVTEVFPPPLHNPKAAAHYRCAKPNEPSAQSKIRHQNDVALDTSNPRAREMYAQDTLLARDEQSRRKSQQVLDMTQPPVL